MNDRIEKDSLWERMVKSDKLYWIQTLRSMENYPISGISILPEMIISYAQIKKSAAQTNMDLWKLDAKIWKLIIAASDEVISWKHNKYFVVDVFQMGAGTATNMNVNEVIANRVLEIMWEGKWQYNLVSPNDHINMSQSTNDTYPTAMRIAILSKYNTLDNSILLLEKTLSKKAKQFKNVLKTWRTHMQDAVPMTLWQEFAAWSYIIWKLRKKLKEANNSLLELNIWWSAIWTWINTHKNYASIVVKYLQENTGIKVKESKDKIASTQSQIEILEYAWILKQISVEIARISADLKLLSSWPNTWLWEINLPSVQPGSSIMPWKINPSILECVTMICYRIIWSESTVSYCVLWWQLELNTNMPLMSYEIISSINILENWLNILREKCIDWITANKDVCKKYSYESSSLATILTPILWYVKVSELVKKQLKTNKNIIDIVLDEKLLSKKELDKILVPKNLIKPI